MTRRIVATALAAVAAGSALAACGSGPGPATVGAEVRPPRAFAFYSHLGGVERDRLVRAGRCIDVLAPNWYSLRVHGADVSARPPDPGVVALAARDGFGLWPVINSRFDRAEAIDHRRWRRAVARAAARLADAHGYDGITIDIEGVAPADRGAFTALVRAVATRLHRSGRELAVYVPRRTAEPPTEWAAPYDWERLTRVADLVLAAGYRTERTAGGEPVVTIGGFDQVLDYAASVSPRRVAPLLRADAPGVVTRAATIERARMRWFGLFTLGDEPLRLWKRVGAPGCLGRLSE